MYIKVLAAIAAAVSAFASATTEPVLADGMPAAAPSVAARKIVHKPRYRAGYHYVRGTWPGGPDPYAYSYDRPGYYPYYNSNYWVPRKQMIARSRYPMRIPEYKSSWGYPLACKIQGRRHCGVPFISPAGDPAHYYRRDQQLPQHHATHHDH